MTGFTVLNIHALFITNNTDRCIAFSMHTAKFAGRQADSNVVTFFSSYQCAGTCGTDKLTSATKSKLNVMNCKTNRNRFQRKCITNRRSCIFAGHNLLSNSQSFRSNNIPLVTICIENQRNISTAVRVIFNCFNSSRNTMLITFEIYDAVTAFMTTALMAYRNTTTSTAATMTMNS